MSPIPSGAHLTAAGAGYRWSKAAVAECAHPDGVDAATLRALGSRRSMSIVLIGACLAGTGE